MNKFIEKLSITVDIEKLLKDLREISSYRLIDDIWNTHNQLGLRHRLNCDNEWSDSIGSLFDNTTKKLTNESDFSEWNSNTPIYLKSILEELAIVENVSWGRIRFMKLHSKTGLSIHRDITPRYHLAITTNENSIFSQCFDNRSDGIRSIGYNIPSDQHWYKVDTTKDHFVYNGGWLARTHLVCCPIIKQ